VAARHKYQESVIAMAIEEPRNLNILHVMRAPVGGLFRHVADLVHGQAQRGHRIGLIADAHTGSARADAILAALAPDLALGLTRVPMSRELGTGDVAAVRHVTRRAADVGADVIHGHGAKGGAFARMARAGRAIRVYTPHGGSLHYRWTSPVGFVYLAAERALQARTDLFLFESIYGCEVYSAKLGRPGGLVRIVHNGVAAAEFAPITHGEQATELAFVGELRMLKGVDVLIDALAVLARDGRRVGLTVVGEGSDRAAFEARCVTRGLAGSVRFVGAQPARAAFALGRILVVPSRAESLPYVVLEAAAAGHPVIATAVGGISEIFGPDAGRLVPADDPDALARAIVSALDNADDRQATALRLQTRVRAAFSSDAMTDAVIAGYGEALAGRASPAETDASSQRENPAR
jgi:glycosyltransferase involved in cell wall biosynthesis